MTREQFEAIKEAFGPCTTLYECNEWEDISDDDRSLSAAGFARLYLDIEDVYDDRDLGATREGVDIDAKIREYSKRRFDMKNRVMATLETLKEN